MGVVYRKLDIAPPLLFLLCRPCGTSVNLHSNTVLILATCCSIIYEGLLGTETTTIHKKHIIAIDGIGCSRSAWIPVLKAKRVCGNSLQERNTNITSGAKSKP